MQETPCLYDGVEIASTPAWPAEQTDSQMYDAQAEITGPALDDHHSGTAWAWQQHSHQGRYYPDERGHWNDCWGKRTCMEHA
eukprot:1551143-Amphidinium_carterae.1